MIILISATQFTRIVAKITVRNDERHPAGLYLVILRGLLLMHGLEQSIINIRNNTIMVIKLHLLGNTINDIAAEVKLSKTEVLEIIEKFKSN